MSESEIAQETTTWLRKILKRFSQFNQINLHGVLKLVIEDDYQYVYYVDLGRLELLDRELPPDCIVRIQAHSWQEFMSGKLVPDDAILQSKLNVAGDLNIILQLGSKLRGLFPMVGVVTGNRI